MARIKPNWDPNDAAKAARKTLKALEKYGKQLEERLPAGITEGLKNDLAVLTGSKVSRPAFAKAAGAKTKSERAIAEDGADLLGRFRESLKTCPVSTLEVLKAVGVGTPVDPRKTASVASGLTALIEASKSYTDIFRAAGILARDLSEASGLLQNLFQADATQQDAIDAKTGLTGQKDEAQVRIERDVASIAAAGQMEFRNAAAKRAVFEKLMPKIPTKKKGKPLETSK